METEIVELDENDEVVLDNSENRPSASNRVTIKHRTSNSLQPIDTPVLNAGLSNLLQNVVNANAATSYINECAEVIKNQKKAASVIRNSPRRITSGENTSPSLISQLFQKWMSCSLSFKIYTSLAAVLFLYILGNSSYFPYVMAFVFLIVVLKTIAKFYSSHEERNVRLQARNLQYENTLNSQKQMTRRVQAVVANSEKFHNYELESTLKAAEIREKAVLESMKDQVRLHKEYCEQQVNMTREFQEGETRRTGLRNRTAVDLATADKETDTNIARQRLGRQVEILEAEARLLGERCDNDVTISGWRNNAEVDIEQMQVNRDLREAERVARKERQRIERRARDAIASEREKTDAVRRRYQD